MCHDGYANTMRIALIGTYLHYDAGLKGIDQLKQNNPYKMWHCKEKEAPTG